MKVKYHTIRHIKDYLRSLPPNVSSPMLLGEMNRPY